MIPNTVLGLALFAASLGPGYVYVRERAHRAARVDQSPIAEAVEMLVAGALAAVLSAMLVLAVSSFIGLIDENALAKDAGKYIVTEPLRGFGPILAYFALAYGVAWGFARAVHRGKPRTVDPAGTAWLSLLYNKRPKPTMPVLTVELQDGRRIVGVLESFTAQLEESRELGLAGPLFVRPWADAPLEPMEDDFLILREAEIRYISGRYVDAAK